MIAVYLCKYFPHSRAFSVMRTDHYRIYRAKKSRRCVVANSLNACAFLHGRTSGGKYLQKNGLSLKNADDIILVVGSVMCIYTM